MRRTPSASGTSRRRRTRTTRRRARAGRSGAGSSGSTASSAARRISSHRRWSPTTTRSTPAAVRRGLPPHRRPGRQRDRAGARPAHDRQRQALLPVLRDRRLPLTAPGAARVGRALSRPIRSRLGRLAGGDVRATARRRVAAVVGGAVAATRLGAGVGLVVRGPATAVRPVHGGVRRLPVPHRQRDRSPRRRTRRAGRARQHAAVRPVRQRRELGRRTHRLGQRHPTVEPRRPQLRGRARPHRRARRARDCTTTTRGAGPSPATRRSAGGSARYTRAVSPTR